MQTRRSSRLSGIALCSMLAACGGGSDPQVTGRAGTTQLAAHIDINSPSSLQGHTGVAYRMYQAAFGRAPDPSGLEWWSDRLARGDVSVDALAAAYYNSPEFTQRFGTNLTNSQYVTQLYRNVLGREPDAEGVLFHVGHLDANRMTRPGTMAFFSESPENVQRVRDLFPGGPQPVPLIPACNPPRIVQDGQCIDVPPVSAPVVPGPPACEAPKIIENGQCVEPPKPPQPPVACEAPKVVQNGQCVDPPPGPVTNLEMQVNTTNDTRDAAPGDGQCRDAANLCSLRAALEEANGKTTSGTISISLPDGLFSLTEGELPITKSLTLTGAGTAATRLIGGDRSRIFNLGESQGVVVTISKVGMERGRSESVGGAIAVGKGTTLNLASSTVTNSRAATLGGAVYVAGTLNMSDSIINGNEAAPGEGGGGINGTGGGIFVSEGAQAVINNSAILGNRATRGGGIGNNGGTVRLRNTTLSGNLANTNGGGIYNIGAMEIRYSTIARNQANTLNGGGRDADNAGGGIYNVPTAPNAASPNRIVMAASLLAMNQDLRTAGSPGSAPDCHSREANTIVSEGFNLISLLTAATCSVQSASTDIIGGPNSVADPLIEPAVGVDVGTGANAIITHALQPNSVAINAIPQPNCAAATDQRGVARPQGSGCDIGAHENR